MGKIKSVLFVCTGNSCRSIMAEGLMKKALKELGRADIDVRSAGIRTVGGMPPTFETKHVMNDESADVSGLRSKELNVEMIKNSDLILVMEKIHKDEVLRMIPEAASKTYLLKEFGNTGKIDDPEKIGIPDPIGKPMEDYKSCVGMIKKEIHRIVKLL